MVSVSTSSSTEFDFDPQSQLYSDQYMDAELNSVLAADRFQIKQCGKILSCPATPNVLQLLEEYVKKCGLVLLTTWSPNLVELDRKTTLGQLKLCELTAERTNPYSEAIMKEPMPTDLALVYEQLAKAKVVAAELRDLFDVSCPRLLLYNAEQRQNQILQHKRASPAPVSVLGQLPLRASDEVSKYRSDFTQRLNQWHLLPQPNYNENGMPVTPPSQVYGVRHFLRLITKLPEITRATGIPPKTKEMICGHLDALKRFLLERDLATYCDADDLAYDVTITEDLVEEEELLDV